MKCLISEVYLKYIKGQRRKYKEGLSLVALEIVNKYINGGPMERKRIEEAADVDESEILKKAHFQMLT